MQSRRPAPLNVVSEDPEGTTWALPEGAIARFGKGLREKHDSEVALSPDYTYFAVGTRIGLWWYEMSSRLPIALWETERGLIASADFSPDGEWIAIANWDGVLKVMDVQSSECIAQMKRMEEQNIYAHVVFSPDGKWIATAANSKRRIVEILDVQNGVCIARMDWEGHETKSGISRLGFSPDRKFLAATAGYQTYVWPSETGTPIMKFEGRNFAFSPDSRLLACTTHGDKTLHVWEFGKSVPKMIFTESGTFRKNPFYSLRGKLLATVDQQDTIEVWDVERCEKRHTLELHPESIHAKWLKKFPQLALSDTHVGATPSEKAKVKNINTFSTPGEFACQLGPVQFSPDGRTLACKRFGGGIVLWDVARKQSRETLLKKTRFRSFTFRPDGNMSAVAFNINRSNNEQTISVWDVEKSDESIVKFTQQTQFGRLVFTPMGNQFAVGSRENTIYLWNFKRRAKLEALIGHTNYISSLAFSPDGKRLVSGAADKTARVWDVELGEQIAMLPIGEPRTPIEIVFSPCGKVIAGGMDDEIRFWCAEQLTTLRTILQPDNNWKPYALAFSQCGKYLASGDWWQRGMVKTTIRLWDVATGENIHTFWGHTTDVQSLDFSPDGTLLASGGFDGTILLWDVRPFIDA